MTLKKAKIKLIYYPLVSRNRFMVKFTFHIYGKYDDGMMMQYVSIQ